MMDFYRPTVDALSTRGKLAMRRSADQLREVGYTAAMAEEDGWTVDRTSYPWVAYVGPRFDTDAFLFLHSEPQE